ncbi:uncharacterized protein LOC107263038 isoform X2 [Cephus cinctus]|uniref:Uncharacterized protein LOC107263038 isoform X2 n=1 Tax=Cephus cinctus TaxID=211228 RepID=A0AAJ7FCQ4_CEPCN|nr:uncharacterized protein LOC107263038 isoform X2 [Cephus cinctus]
MLSRGKACPRAASTTAVAVSAREPLSVGVTPQLPLRNDPYPSNADNVFGIPRVDLHEFEWIDPDSLDAEVSKLVIGSSATRIPRRWRTSTSSGYSSHSPPLSAGSYSCCTSAPIHTPGPGAALQRTSANHTSAKAALAVIHESETIPRPIWPCVTGDSIMHDDGDVLDDAERLRSGIYACCTYGHGYGYSHCDWDYGQSTTSSAQEVLFELSRTLNSVIEGGTDMKAEEILRDISRTVAQGINTKKRCLCEDYVYRLSSASSNVGKESPGVNPVNVNIYGKSRSLRVPRCTCEKKTFSQGLLSPFFTQIHQVNEERKKKDATPAVFLVPEYPRNLGETLHRYDNVSGLCNYRTYRNFNDDSQNKKKHNAISGNYSRSKEDPFAQQNSRNVKSIGRKGYQLTEPEYTTLECSDGTSSSEGIVESIGKTDWDRDVRVFDRDLDFTLDGSRAERLGRVIAKAKRKRQWCRAVTAILGLVFFVLSVVVVSLSVTRGRKVFGSM